MTHYDMHPPKVEAIRSRALRGDYMSDVLPAIRVLLARVDELERQLAVATEGRVDDH